MLECRQQERPEPSSLGIGCGNIVFLKHAREKLLTAFTPQVHETMNEFGVTQKYQAIIGKYDSLPFARNLSQGNVEEYTADKALDGRQSCVDPFEHAGAGVDDNADTQGYIVVLGKVIAGSYLQNR